MQQILHIVATKICSDWKWLARKLKIDECDIEAADANNHQIEEKAFQVLLKWHRTSGQSSATRDMLEEALKEIGRSLIAEDIKRIDLSTDGEVLPKPVQEINCDGPVGAESLTPMTDEYKNSHQITRNEYGNSNGQELRNILSMSNELSSLLKNTQEGIATCDSASLVQRQRILQNTQNFEEILTYMIKEYEDHITTSSDSAAGNVMEVKREHSVRAIQTKQTMSLIQNILHENKNENRKTQSVYADLPKRWTSIAELRPKCVSAGASPSPSSNHVEISLPLVVVRPNTVEQTDTPGLSQSKKDKVEMKSSSVAPQPDVQEREMKDKEGPRCQEKTEKNCLEDTRL